MKWDQIEGNWRQIVGNLQEMLGKLIGAQSLVAAGRRQQVSGRIQGDYGITIARAERHLSELTSRWHNLKN